MRPELEQLARIDSYVNNTMNAAESAAFEAEMANNLAMREAVETQNLLITAVNRKALLAHVVAAAPATMPPPRDGSILSKFKWPIVLSSVVIGAVISFFALKSDKGELQKSHKNLHANVANDTIENEGLRAGREANLVETNDIDFTYVPTHPEIVSTSRRQFGGLETWITPELQQITIDPTQDELIECKDGTVIFIPEDAFVDANGNVVDEPVTLEIIEALTMDKIVAYNLATMNGDNALKSGGMVYVQPKLNGTDLDLAEGKSLHIEIPTDEYDTDMQAWEGVPDGNGNLNWENPKAIENYLIPVAMSSLDFLPNGFREEVAATLPFKNYTENSRELEDSLYYALGITSSNKVNALSYDSISRDSLGDAESQPFQLPIKIKSNTPRLLNVKSKSKVQRGLGGVKFQNLPNKNEFTATFFIGQESYNTTIDTSVLQTDLLGLVSIKIETAGCDPYTLSNVLVESDKIVFVDCSSWKCFVANGTDNVFTSSEKVRELCYIKPSDIYAIHQREFEETFLATKEFQERLQVLHTIENAQPLFDLYINNLDKNVHEIDQQVADKLSGENKAKFNAFAAEKLTTVRPNGQEYAELKQFYTAKSKEKQQKVRKEQRAYAQKSAAELQAVQDELALLRFDYNVNQQNIRSKYAPKSRSGSPGVSPPRNNFMQSSSSFQAPQKFQNTNPQVGQQAAYKVNWYGTGWMNIDGFLHELSKGKKQIPINVADSKGMKVYQSVNSLNTLLTLNKTGDGYNAYFPTVNSPTFVNSLALSVSRADGKLKVAAQFFNPYASTTVTLNDWETVTEDEFKSRLKSLYPGGKRLLKAIKTEERLASEALERKLRAEEERKKRDKELNALKEQMEKEQASLQAKTEKIRMRQAAERSYMHHLENFINPCHSNYGATSNGKTASRSIVEFPDEEAEFPGGTVEFMRWISDNVQYPKEAIDAGAQGNIYVNFIVEPDGSASNVKISNSDLSLKLLEAEAVRLVRGMPPWKSAKVNGKEVRSQCSVPITFTLTE